MHEALVALAALGLAGWLGVLAGTARAWDLRPIAEDEPPPPDPEYWPSVTVLVPARDEARILPESLPALLAQDYPGEWRVVLVDDRSSDDTARVAQALGSARLRAIAGSEIPRGWVGKVWALEQGALVAKDDPARYLLLTDADIRHAPGSLRRLVAESEAAGLTLNSRMARLRCHSRAERLLIPPFLLFFNLLYPMRRVNDPRSRVAAAAGGCVLVRHDALGRAGGLGAIRDRVIDDVSLARVIKRLDEPIRLSVSRDDVTSLRAHDLASVWRMVRRTAFTELRSSWFLLTVTIGLLVVLFPLPPLLLGAAIGLIASGSAGLLIVVAALAGLAWAGMAAVYLPTTRYFDLRPVWTLTLPLAGCLFGAMTIDSAMRSIGRRRAAW